VRVTNTLNQENLYYKISSYTKGDFNMFKTRDLVEAGLLLAIGIILPTVFHMTGINGAVFLPMHIPVIISGFILGPVLGSIIGFITPFINHSLTGMPQTPVLWIMMIELTVYGLLSGLLYNKMKINLMLSLIISMIGGRIGAAFTLLILANGFGITMPPIRAYIYGMTLAAIPGIIIQIILIPILIKAYNTIDN
jgi:hypothetical protein